MTNKSKTPPEALEAGFALMRLTAERADTEQRIREQVATILELGGSWTTVAVALGVSRQAAQQRYGHSA